MSAGTSEHHERLLDGRRVALVGKLAGMSRRRAEQLVRDHGGSVAAHVDAETELVVVGDETPHADRLMAAAESLDDSARQAWQEGRLQLVRESNSGRLDWSTLGEKSNGCIRR